MQIINELPGRIRLKNTQLYFDSGLSKYINLYTQNLYGVKNCRVNPASCTILIIYDTEKTDYNLLQRNIDNAIKSALSQSREDLKRYDVYYEVLKKQDKARRGFLLFGITYILFKLKTSVFGKFSISRNIKVLQVASLVTIVGGYPLIKGYYRRFTKHMPTDSDILLKLTAVSFTLIRESSKGVLVLAFKALNDYIKYSAEAECLRALHDNISSTATMAWVTTADNGEILVPLDKLNIGDTIHVHTGEIIPANGKVTKGRAIVNSLYYTGQPVITHITRGHLAHEGLIVVTGEISIRISSLPQALYKQDISIKTLELNRRVVSYQEKVAPLAISAATLNFVFTGSMQNALSVLLLLCPSATGVAFASGMKSYFALLNKNSIYLRNVNTIEKILKVDNIVFDKTGTLTYGKMEIVDIISLSSDYKVSDILRICAACEVDNYHPIAITIQEEVVDDYDTSKVQSSVLIPSKGIKAIYDGHKVLIGNKKLLEQSKINISEGIERYNEFEEKLLTPIMISIDRKLIGIIAMQDILRQDSIELVKRLKSRGISNIALLTGDSPDKADNTAKILGINRVYANKRQSDKLDIIRQNKKDNVVLMVGDGVNDIPAMREADISVSFANTKCDRVKLGSDCIVFEDDITKLADLIVLTHKSYEIIEQNLLFTKLYNLSYGVFGFFTYFDLFAAKSLNTINSLLVLLLNKRIEYQNSRLSKI